MSVCLYVCMSVCLYVCMSVCLYVCVSVCPYVPVSVCRMSYVVCLYVVCPLTLYRMPLCHYDTMTHYVRYGGMAVWQYGTLSMAVWHTSVPAFSSLCFSVSLFACRSASSSAIHVESQSQLFLSYLTPHNQPPRFLL
jgi:hypothetical protein